MIVGAKLPNLSQHRINAGEIVARKKYPFRAGLSLVLIQPVPLRVTPAKVVKKTSRPFDDDYE
jgi:hypothetical protein